MPRQTRTLDRRITKELQKRNRTWGDQNDARLLQMRKQWLREGRNVKGCALARTVRGW